MEMDSRQLEIYRRMTPNERIAVACGLHDFAHQRVVQCLREQYPEKSAREILVEAACRFLNESAGVLLIALPPARGPS